MKSNPIYAQKYNWKVSQSIWARVAAELTKNNGASIYMYQTNQEHLLKVLSL